MTLCALLPLAALLFLSACGSQPKTRTLTKIEFVRLDIDPAHYAPVAIPVPPERGATLKTVTAFGVRQGTALRACNLKLEAIARDIEAQAPPPPAPN